MLVEFLFLFCFYFLTLRWRKLYLGTGLSLFLSVPKPGPRSKLRRRGGTGAVLHRARWTENPWPMTRPSPSNFLSIALWGLGIAVISMGPSSCLSILACLAVWDFGMSR